MQNQPDVVIEPNRNSLSNPAQGSHLVSKGGVQRRLGSSQEKRPTDEHTLQRLPQDALFERFDIDNDVRQLRHL